MGKLNINPQDYIPEHKYIRLYNNEQEYQSDIDNHILEECAYCLVNKGNDVTESDYQPSHRTTNGDNLKILKYLTEDRINLWAGLKIIWGYFGWEETTYELDGEELLGGKFYKVRPMSVVKTVPDLYQYQHLINFAKDINTITEYEEQDFSTIKAASYLVNSSSIQGTIPRCYTDLDHITSIGDGPLYVIGCNGQVFESDNINLRGITKYDSKNGIISRYGSGSLFDMKNLPTINLGTVQMHTVGYIPWGFESNAFWAYENTVANSLQPDEDGNIVINNLCAHNVDRVSGTHVSCFALGRTTDANWTVNVTNRKCSGSNTLFRFASYKSTSNVVANVNIDESVSCLNVIDDISSEYYPIELNIKKLEVYSSGYGVKFGSFNAIKLLTVDYLHFDTPSLTLNIDGSVCPKPLNISANIRPTQSQVELSIKERFPEFTVQNNSIYNNYAQNYKINAVDIKEPINFIYTGGSITKWELILNKVPNESVVKFTKDTLTTATFDIKITDSDSQKKVYLWDGDLYITRKFEYKSDENATDNPKSVIVKVPAGNSQRISMNVRLDCIPQVLNLKFLHSVQGSTYTQLVNLNCYNDYDDFVWQVHPNSSTTQAAPIPEVIVSITTLPSKKLDLRAVYLARSEEFYISQFYLDKEKTTDIILGKGCYTINYTDHIDDLNFDVVHDTCLANLGNSQIGKKDNRDPTKGNVLTIRRELYNKFTDEEKEQLASIWNTININESES